MANFNFLKTDYQLKQLKNKFSIVWYAGKINGYWCTVNFDTKECSITIGAHKDEEHKSLVQLLRGEGIYKKESITAKNATVTIKYKIPFLTSSNKKKFDEIIENVTSVLKRNSFTTGGFFDGDNETSLSIYDVGPNYLYLTEAEYKKVVKDLESKKIENINTSENYILGILGVLGISLIGIVAYVLIGMAGYYVWAVPAFLTAASFGVYKYLAKKISVFSAVIIFILSAISLFIGTFLEYTWKLYNFYKEEYMVTFTEVLKEAPDIIFENPAISSEFIRDMLINGAILIIGFGISFYSAYKSEDRFVKIKKVDDEK